MTTISEARLASIMAIAASYHGVPADVLEYRLIQVPWEERCARVPVPLPNLPGTLVQQTVNIFPVYPGRPDVHGGWRFRFGYHSRARVAALWIEE